MDRNHAIIIVSRNVRAIRTESQLSENQLANALGITKKSVVQLESGQTRADWTLVCAICAIFQESEVLERLFGGDPLEVIKLLSDEQEKIIRSKTKGGKIWWKNIKSLGRYKLQQNVISQHYRIIDDLDYRLKSTFNKETAFETLDRLAKDRFEKR
ncbi:helix-turn-helix domain-containing protein [Shouchella sp. 1P09AA]|uniref:helix-turn-helix domain-containing protein n=1 Tax=unclassified Shouchella TaxID=2893065 RepID=UPI0039A218F5